jgi:hypothetical protein
MLLFEMCPCLQKCVYLFLQASWYAQTMLYNVCEDINHMGGQTLHRYDSVEILMFKKYSYERKIIEQVTA